MCAADEVAVDMFLAGRIKFSDIPLLVEDVLTRHSAESHIDLESVMSADAWAREQVKEAVKQERLHC
jgi:1-deoxy-D-xylulose-5-phosphate reductoisomerase